MVLLSVPAAALRYDFTIAGGASGGINSAIHVWVEQRKAADSTEAPPATKYALLLDAGGLSMPTEAIDGGNDLQLLVTHMHSDHCTGIPALLAARTLNDKSTRVVLPHAADAEARLRRVLALFEELNTNEGEPYPFKLAIETAMPGAELAGPAQKRVVVPFATSHRVPSNGYAVVHRKRKLRPELLVDAATGEPLPKAEHAARMKQLRAELTEDELYETEEVVELAYTGDSTISWLDGAGASLALKAKLLVTEATFVCDAVDRDGAASRGHTHLDDICANAERFSEVGALVLTHFSRRYSEADVRDAMTKKLPPALREKTTPLLLAGHHR